MIKQPFKTYIQQIDNKNKNRTMVRIFDMFDYNFKYELFKRDMNMHDTYYLFALFRRYMGSIIIDD